LNKEVEPALLVYFDVKKYPVGEDYFDGPVVMKLFVGIYVKLQSNQVFIW